MRVLLRHRTLYRYDQPVGLGPHIVRLRPAAHTRATIEAYNLELTPTPTLRWQQDPWGNRIARLTFSKDQRVKEFAVAVDLALDIRPVNPFDYFVDDRCEQLPFEYPDGLKAELAPLLERTKGPLLEQFVAEQPPSGHVTDWLVALNARVAARVEYLIRLDPGLQTSEQTLTKNSGSCRDSAQLLVDVLRANGLAARFVSGYLIQLVDEGNVPDLAKGVLKDVADLHAWAEVYVPGAGWIGLDGTSGLFCGEGHIPLACTVNAESAAPVTGTSERAASGFEYEMEVVRLGHEPRPRKPYTEEQWTSITEAGEAVDAALLKAGVKLTIGGEPTYTSRIHPAKPEWNVEALGDTKRAQGLRMARELMSRFGEGSLLQYRMGKHYPGESLPRWALALIWRRDAVPVWKNRELLALADNDPATKTSDQQLAHAARLAALIGAELDLQVTPMAAYEDPWHFIQQEENLPTDVDPLAANLADPEERRRLANVLGHGLKREVGYAVPLTRDDGAWRTGVWSFRRKHLFLIPGDSPMGLRLPLDRMRGEPPESIPVDNTQLTQDTELDPRPLLLADADGRRQFAEIQRLAEPETEIRKTLCVEPRAGVLHVFLPPVDTAEDFLELVRAVEAAAAECDVPVRVEGYGPPSDPRLESCVVTPDPGVIEINLPVANSLAEYTRLVETITDAANHADLCMEKYQIDGRVAGSGGGNHLTLGGPSALESPFLTRPELLGSLLRFFQNHPSLSFLFTGLFVGPTSQTPRIDEARHDALLELELALSQLPKLGSEAFPWTIDRLLRNLLVDVSGNPHRTEISIDKLYDPHGPAGRQGLVELRAFEMPPHERMASAQALLVRALVGRFAQAPYREKLVPWGTQLHDRFMLPQYLWRDFQDVCADLQRHGLGVDAEWYLPFLDFRCPTLGRAVFGDVVLELRSALEPWATLGEQPSGPAVARYVDSSLERLQVKVQGLVPGRHVVSVNGFELPLFPSGTEGEGVAGVRFRAWQPPNCLQPDIPVQHPVRLDVVDQWAQRSLGGCQYHVWHPEGRGYDEPPLTAYEAAARRASRFTVEGHTPFPARIKRLEPRPEHPHTLDLRWAYAKPR